MKKIILFFTAGYVLLIGAVVGFIFLLIAGTGEEPEQSIDGGILNTLLVSDEVLAYRPLVEEYAKEYGISDYVDYLLAIMMVESGGKGKDVMQCSESLGYPPNTIVEPEFSIKQGCNYFAGLVNVAKENGCDVDTAIQSYNFGGSFTTYVSSNGKRYSFDLAESFSKEKAGGQRVTYSNPIAVEKNGGWRYKYGNMFYVLLVKQYIGVTGGGKLGDPCPGARISSEFGYRVAPTAGATSYHAGRDYAAPAGTPIYASESGTVTVSKYNSARGNYVDIDHGNGMLTRYQHCSEVYVSVGDTVKRGEVIAAVGTTGVSTGNHLHFEVLVNGTAVDPREYLE